MGEPMVILKERLRVEADGEKQTPESRFYDILLPDGTMAGSCSMILAEVPIEEGGSLGYAVAEEWRGHGYAAAACREMLRIAAAEGISQLTIACEAGSPASIRVAEKLGAECLGRVELTKGDALYLKGVRCVTGYRIRTEQR